MKACGLHNYESDAEVGELGMEVANLGVVDELDEEGRCRVVMRAALW